MRKRIVLTAYKCIEINCLIKNKQSKCIVEKFKFIIPLALVKLL